MNYEQLDKIHNLTRMSSIQAEKITTKLLTDLRTQVNASVASFSKIHQIIEQKEPFEKTPTQKIKRFLYQ